MGYNKPTDVIEAIIDAFYKKRDIEAILSCVTEDAQWIGSEAGEVLFGKTEIRKRMEHDLAKYPYELPIEFGEPNIRMRDEEHASAVLIGYQKLVHVKGKGYVVRVTLNLERQKKQCWLISSLHVSVPNTQIVNFELSDKLMRSEEIQKLLDENTPVHVGIFLLKDTTLKMVDYSEHLIEGIEYSASDFERVVKENALDVIYEEDRAHFFITLLDAVHGKKIMNTSFRIIMGNGRQKWVHVSARIVEEVDGESLIEAAFIPMAEETILYYDIANHATNGIYVISKKNHKLLYVNRSVERLLTSMGEKCVLGGKCYRTLCGYDKPCENCVIQSKKPVEYFHERLHASIIAKSHDIIWNGTEASVVYINDITKQKEEEQSVAEARRNLTIAMNHANMLYWEYDYKNSRAIADSNIENVFDLPSVLEDYPESYLKKGYVSEEDVFVFRENINAMREGAEYREFAAKVHTKYSDYNWMKFRLTGIKDVNGNPVRAICTAEPITEYKELEQRFETALTQNNIECWTYDISRKTISLKSGRKYAKKYGRMAEVKDVPEVHIRDKFVHPDDVNKIRYFYKRVNDGEKQVDEVLRFWDEEKKEYRFNHCTYTTIFDKTNTPLYAIGSSIDITERLEERRGYETAVEYRKHTQVENQILSAHCSITQNRVLEISSGLGEELLNRYGNVRDIFFQQFGLLIVDEEQRQEFWKKFLNAGIIHNFEIGNTQFSMGCGMEYNHEYKWILIHMTVVSEPSTGDLEGFLVVTDRTETRQQENILETALQWDFDYVASADLYDDTVDIYTSRTDLNDLKDVIPGGRYSYSKRCKMAADSIVIEEDRKRYLENMAAENIFRNLEQNDIYEFTYHIYTKENTIRAKRTRFTANKHENKMIVFSRTDVTDMLAEQDAQKKALSKSLHEAEKATKAKTDFLARMSHDMRTPMNAIIGLSSLTLDDAQNPEIAKENMGKMRQASDFLLGLVNDILDMAKIEDGSVELNMEPYTYSEFLLNMKTMFKPQCEAKGITINFVEPVHMDPTGMTDKLRINQIFFNIFSNAVKYTPSGGRIDCFVENLKMEGNVLVADYIIKDTGIGMSESFQKHMFDPFVRESNEITTQLQGSGLGLSITKQLVELMGGTIHIESKKNHGTCVTIHMGFEQVSPQQKLDSQKLLDQVDDSALAGKKILLVEDHPLNAQIAQKLLEKKQMQVTYAENGKIAVEKFKASGLHDFDAILMDIRMPEMSGLDATKAIRALKRADAKTVPIIAMSANAYQEDIQKSLAAGMNAHLAKPIEPEKMYGAIAKQLFF